MASKVVLDAVEAQLTAEFTAIPVYYPNSQSKPPAALGAFVQVEIPIGSGQALTLDGTTRETGTIRLVVHVPITDGPDNALTYADALGTALRQQKLTSGADSIQTGAPSSPVSLGQEGGYYQVSTSVPFVHFI